MLHRIRLAMQTKSFHKLDGEVEGDETMIGGLYKNMHKRKRLAKPQGTGSTGKTIVQGVLKRGGEVRCKVLPNTLKATIQGNVRANVEPGAAFYTDAAAGYRGLDSDYNHAFIDHAIKYVEGRVHTNGIENFWALLKRGLKGTYVAVAPRHLSRYVDEQAFRFNKRKGSDKSRFLEALHSVVGKRLTYDQLTAS